MPDYRLYYLDAGGSIAAVKEFSASDDGEAIRVTGNSGVGQARELWCRARMIRALEPPRR